MRKISALAHEQAISPGKDFAANLSPIVIALLLAAGLFFVLGDRVQRIFEGRDSSLPPGARMRLGTLRFRHKGPVMRVAYSPDGRLIASASLDGTIRLWNATSGKEVLRIQRTIREWAFPWFGGTLTFSPDGKIIALGRYDLGFWDTATGAELDRLNRIDADGQFLSLRFCPDRRILAVMRDQGLLKVFNTMTGREIRRFTCGGRAEFADLSADGNVLAAVVHGKGSKHHMHIWNLQTGKQVYSVLAADGYIRSQAFAPNGKHLAFTQNGQVRILNWSTGKIVKKRKAGVHGCLTWSEDGAILAMGNSDQVDLWNVRTGQKTNTLSCYQWVQSVAFSPDGKNLALGSGCYCRRSHPINSQMDGVVHVWDVKTAKRIGPRQGHQSMAMCAAFSSDGKTLASGGKDRTIRLWSALTGQELRVLLGHEDDVVAVSFSPDGKLLASASRDGTVRLWNTTTGAQVRRLDHDGAVFTIAFSPDGKMLASADSKKVRLWDPVHGMEVPQWQNETGGRKHALAISPDGKTLASGGGQRFFFPFRAKNSIHRVHIATGRKTVLPQQPGSMGVCSLAYSPDGKTLAAGYMNTRLRLWNAPTGKLLRTIETRAEGTVAFSPDGKLLASAGGLSPIVYLYDATTGQTRREIQTEQGGVNSLCFSPDGKMLATAGHDSTVLIWNLR